MTRIPASTRRATNQDKVNRKGKSTARQRILGCGLTALLMLSAASSLAQQPAAQSPQDAASFPSKPIRVIVPFPPGGPTDVMGRAIAQRLQVLWPVGAVVENRAGGNSFIGTEFVAKSAPDGHTLLVAAIGTLAVNPALYRSLPYDPVKDFAPVTNIATMPMLLVVPPGSNIHTVKDLVAQVRANPGKLTYASGGAGQAAHLAGALFERTVGSPMVHVAYKGSAPALADVMGGHVNMIFDGMANAMPQVRAGKLRAVAVTTTRRASVAPDVPTVAEAGFDDFDVGSWFGLLAPAATPAPVVRKLNGAVVAILRNPEVVSLMSGIGLVPTPGTPEEFAAYIQSETRKWTRVVKEAGIKAD